MRKIDLHTDVISKLYDMGPDSRLKNNECHIDIEKLKAGGAYGHCFAMYVDLASTKKPMADCLDLIDYFKREVNRNSEALCIATNVQDLSNECINGLITIEEGGIIEGDIDNLELLYKHGARMMGLTWNYLNEIGAPNFEYTYSTRGLTEFGYEVVEAMNRLGMIIDVSHLSDQGFWDVVNRSTHPIVASHSNCRAVHENPRNLTDPMIRRIAESGGVAGINFYSGFLSEDPVSRVGSIVKHVNHMKQVGGIEVVALGTDFDGIDCETEIKDYSELDVLVDALKDSGLTTKEVERIMCENALRVMKEVL